MLGILGGGQLGRMLAVSAHKLGINSCIYTDQPSDCGLSVVNNSYVAPYSDAESLTKFAKECEYVTFEFENIPTDALKICAEHSKIAPGELSLSTASNRLKEKTLLRSLNIKTVEFCSVSTIEEINACTFDKKIIKTNSGGYDGKGQWVDNFDDVDFSQALIAEEFVPLEKEISVLVARDRKGNCFAFEPNQNTHKNQILHKTIFPASVPKELAELAKSQTIELANKLQYVGVICLEFFITTDGRLLGNEIAPRVHNSGHHTIESCTVSQFEQHVRAVYDLPLITNVQIQKCEMTNIIGSFDYTSYLKDGGSLHIYGKPEAREGRKMGHHTKLL